jgi:cytochrome-b5 reductase
MTTEAYNIFLAASVCVSVLALLSFVLALKRRRPFLQSDVFKAARLIEKETVTHNTSRYRFSLGGSKRLGLPIGQHISFKFEDAVGKEVMRSYTPVSGNESAGYVDFVIKVYPAGKMSQHVDRLCINDSILMRGPKGQYKYKRGAKKSLGARTMLVADRLHAYIARVCCN